LSAATDGDFVAAEQNVRDDVCELNELGMCTVREENLAEKVRGRIGDG
jgi:hypothetical protein